MCAGMKAIPRFREAIAFLKLRHQPAHIKYPLVALHVASNPSIYSADQLHIKQDVRTLITLARVRSSSSVDFSCTHTIHRFFSASLLA